MIRAIFGSRANNSKDWCLTLTSPSDVFIAHSINEVTQVVEAAEKASLHGAYVALILSYEAASAFDPALVTHERSSSFPLAWAAVFPNAGDCNPHVQSEIYSTSSWSPGVSESEYRAAVEKVLELIAAGQTYQANYSFPMTATFKGDPFAYYLDLDHAQGAHYSAFLDLGDFQILSLSPELFFERKGRNVRTKPMKGTIRRGTLGLGRQRLSENSTRVH